MIGDWQDEWDLKRRGSDRSVNRHDTCRVAAHLNKTLKLTPWGPLGSEGSILGAKEWVVDAAGQLSSILGIK
jgi:hypothetical protein